MDTVKVGRTKLTARHEGNIDNHWWADCPVCPVSKGFNTFPTHALALRAALMHVKYDHADKDFIDGY